MPAALPVYALYAATGALALALAFAGVQTTRLATVRGELQAERRERAEDLARLERNARAQAESFRATEAQWARTQQENADAADQARRLAQQHAGAADAAARSLRKRVAALAAACDRPARHPAAAARGPAASAPGELLAHVLSRVDAAAGELAEYADRAGIAGEQCAADYEALRAGAKPQTSLLTPP